MTTLKLTSISPSALDLLTDLKAYLHNIKSLLMELYSIDSSRSFLVGYWDAMYVAEYMFLTSLGMEDIFEKAMEDGLKIGNDLTDPAMIFCNQCERMPAWMADLKGNHSLVKRDRITKASKKVADLASELRRTLS